MKARCLFSNVVFDLSLFAHFVARKLHTAGHALERRAFAIDPLPKTSTPNGLTGR